MITTILVDSMFTIFTPKPGWDRYTILQNLIKILLGSDVCRADIIRVYNEKRTLLEQKLSANHGEKWATIDREIVRALLPNVSFNEAAQAGKVISDQTLTNPDFYEVSADSLKFLIRGRSLGKQIIMTSNHDPDKLPRLIEHFSIGAFISAAYTSTEIGFEKPAPEFFHAILEREHLEPRECVMVGNNPVNDIAGARAVGIRAVLYDPQRKHIDFAGLSVERLSDVWGFAFICQD